MTNEEFYDQEIAPALLQLANKCKERGMSFVASVEYDPLTHGRGRTEYMAPDEADKLSAAQRITHWAARCDGNIDKLFMACDRHGRKHGHSSVYLKMAGNHNEKPPGPNDPPVAFGIAIVKPTTNENPTRDSLGRT